MVSSRIYERLPIYARSPWWGEHRSRYRFAQRYVSQFKVLDIACGTGFGCGILADGGAASVVGVDVDRATVEIAAAENKRNNVCFQQANGTKLPFEDESFDVVTSFETIEHITEYELFVRELRRVTRSSGVLVLSTPNLRITSQYPRNPFHLHEFGPEELGVLVRRYYARVEHFGQHLSDRFRIAPFLPGRERASTLLDNMRLIAWKIGNRLPFVVKDALANAFAGHPFYPTENDFTFTTDVASAHVQLVLCHCSP